MKLILAAAAGAAALALSTAATAQERVYDNGPVWDISYVETKPGKFDEYMAYLSTGWRASNEAAKKAGLVLDYKVLTLADPRDGEPDLILMVEYKNMAAFDTPLEEQEAVSKQVFGSVAAANQGMIDREALRKQRGDLIAREVHFIK